MSDWKTCPKCQCMNLNRSQCVDCWHELKDVEAMSTKPSIHRDFLKQRFESGLTENGKLRTMSTEPNCPCANWAREIDLRYPTNHHPKCAHYNDSLMDVWRVTVDGSCFVEHEQDARDTVGDCGTITKEKMHREVFEHLPEFAGF